MVGASHSARALGRIARPRVSPLMRVHRLGDCRNLPINWLSNLRTFLSRCRRLRSHSRVTDQSVDSRIAAAAVAARGRAASGWPFAPESYARLSHLTLIGKVETRPDRVPCRGSEAITILRLYQQPTIRSEILFKTRVEWAQNRRFIRRMRAQTILRRKRSKFRVVIRPGFLATRFVFMARHYRLAETWPLPATMEQIRFFGCQRNRSSREGLRQ
jgi:hypothetical protein